MAKNAMNALNAATAAPTAAPCAPAVAPVGREVRRSGGPAAANDRLAGDAAADMAAETAALRAALSEACDAIEQSARYAFVVGDKQPPQEQFEDLWKANDLPDYERWVRLKRAALNAPRFREPAPQYDDEDRFDMGLDDMPTSDRRPRPSPSPSRGRRGLPATPAWAPVASDPERFPAGRFKEGDWVRLRRPGRQNLFCHPQGPLQVVGAYWFRTYEGPTYAVHEPGGLAVTPFKDDDLRMARAPATCPFPNGANCPSPWGGNQS